MAQLDPLGIMDADLDSCVPTDIITSSDKLGEELHPPGLSEMFHLSGEVSRPWNLSGTLLYTGRTSSTFSCTINASETWNILVYDECLKM